MPFCKHLFVLVCAVLCAACASGPKLSSPSVQGVPWQSFDKLTLHLKARLQLQPKNINLNLHIKAHKNKHLRVDVFSVWNTHEASMYLDNELRPARLQVLLLRQNKLYDLRLNNIESWIEKHKAWKFLKEMEAVWALIFRQVIRAPGWKCQNADHQEVQHKKAQHQKAGDQEPLNQMPPNQEATNFSCRQAQKNINVRYEWRGKKYFTSLTSPELSVQLQVVDFWPEVKNPHKAFKYFSL